MKSLLPEILSPSLTNNSKMPFLSSWYIFWWLILAWISTILIVLLKVIVAVWYVCASDMGIRILGVGKLTALSILASHLGCHTSWLVVTHSKKNGSYHHPSKASQLNENPKCYRCHHDPTMHPVTHLESVLLRVNWKDFRLQISKKTCEPIVQTIRVISKKIPLISLIRWDFHIPS